MEKERRDNPRTEAKGLQAKIMVMEPNRSVLMADVNLLDISQSGIKLRVQKTLIVALGTNIQLEVILPDTMFSLSQQVNTIKNRCVVLEQEVEQISRVLVFFKA